MLQTYPGVLFTKEREQLVEISILFFMAPNTAALFSKELQTRHHLQKAVLIVRLFLRQSA